MSPALLSKRLGELEQSGIIVRETDGAGGGPVYRLTDAGEELRPLIMSMGSWGQRWLESQLSLKNLDPSLLMWDMRRNLNPTPLPPRRVTIQFLYSEITRAQKRWWLIVDKASSHGTVDLCMKDPGYDVDLYIVTDLRTMTAVWMGITTVQEATGNGKLRLSGPPEMVSRMQEWLGLSPFAHEPKQVQVSS